MKALRRIQTKSSFPNPSSPSSPWTHLRSAFVIVTSSSPASCSSSDPHRLKSPWSRRKRKKPLTLRRWRRFFTPEGRLRNGGVDLLKKVRSRGIDPSIRSEVWPFLLGVCDLNSSEEERGATRTWRRKVYERLRRQCKRLQRQDSGTIKLNKINKTTQDEHDSWSLAQDSDSSCSDDACSARESLTTDKDNTEDIGYMSDVSCTIDRDYTGSRHLNSESSDSDSSDENDSVQVAPSDEGRDEHSTSPSSIYISRTKEDFVTWQRIIRLDALRADTEWTPYSSSQALVSENRARRAADAVVLKDYSHLEPSKIFHAARLVSVLEAYALYDPEIGYCQGMSDLLSPILSVIPDDYEAFWCFVGFMKKARQNFRLDEVGITRQLNIVSKIIKSKDSQLYKHLEKVKAEDCFFVYRMVLVMFRRELTLEQTLYLWEVIWADQAAIRAGMGKSSWSRRIKQRAPPTEDLLLYAVAASVLQRRKVIIEKYYSMEEILRECHNMVGKLDVWKLLDDAHDLIVTLHAKIEHSNPKIV
ncbi:Rab-GTPase-TBC domain [Arabidopsis thaliana x Arabidopsis arenosa]|uniref:Rab-GTPase-TBC domain n=1 Tax=Arabidopsis thaliana x Arabidopsis arenosa TaxID=1240361 RepID=A0A8T1YYW4_9BRAS|nr:Rab-GTPase-TBC domain [Arabidopsis thaliana x Arabidopsis arenosa]